MVDMPKMLEDTSNAIAALKAADLPIPGEAVEIQEILQRAIAAESKVKEQSRLETLYEMVELLTVGFVATHYGTCAERDAAIECVVKTFQKRAEDNWK